VSALLQEITGNMKLVADAKGVDLSLHADWHGDLVADVGQLRRLFYNLLDNAIKYTEAGGTVQVTAGPSNGCISIAIRDSGMGIPPEDLPRIFDRFYRADSARTGESGVGLGLALCQSIVKSMGGTIRVNSKVGEGTDVVVDLPQH